MFACHTSGKAACLSDVGVVGQGNVGDKPSGVSLTGMHLGMRSARTIL